MYKLWQRCVVLYSHSSCLHIPAIKNTANSHSRQPGSQNECMWVGKEGPGRKGQSKFFIPWFPLPSPKGWNPLKSFGSLDVWSWRIKTTDYQSLAYLSVPLSSLRHFHCTLLTRLSILWQALPARPATFEKRQESWDTSAFSSFLTQTHMGRNWMPTRSLYGWKEVDD